MSAARPQFSLRIGALSVRFTWRHDRFAHEVFLDDEAIWRSLEGPSVEAGDPRWPASPVLAELSRLDTPDGPAMLGVGRAGRSHFSASIGPGPAGAGLRFEIACRVTEPPGWLGSAYQGPPGLVRIVPAGSPGALPATVQWAYLFTERGAEPLGNARLESVPGGRD